MRNTFRPLAFAAVPVLACAIMTSAAAPASATTLYRSCDITIYDPGSQHMAGVRMSYYITNVNLPGAKHTVVAKWTNIGLDPRNRYYNLYLKGQANANIMSLAGTYRTITTVPAYTTITVKALTLRYDSLKKTSNVVTKTCGTFNFPRP